MSEHEFYRKKITQSEYRGKYTFSYDKKGNFLDTEITSDSIEPDTIESSPQSSTENTDVQTSQTQEGAWNGNYGKTFATSAALLSLALNYRYLPIYER